MHAVLAAEKAIGVLSLDGNGGGLDSRLVSVLVVQSLDGEVVPLAPAGVHAEKHLTPVLGLGAAGSGMESENGVAGVVLPGEQGGQIGLLQRGIQLAAALLHLGQEAGVVLLHGHLHQSGEILPLGGQAGVVLQLVFQLLGALEHLLRSGHVVPEVGVAGLLLQLLHLPAGSLQIQGRRQLFQTGADGSQFLLIGVVFNDRHG